MPFVARTAGLPDRLTDWIDRRGDLALAAVLTAAGVFEIWLEAHSFLSNRSALLILLVTIPLIWRRRWPLLVMAVVFVGAAISREAPYVDITCAVIAAYSVGTYERRRLVGLLELTILGLVVVVAFGGVIPSIPTFIAPFAVLFAFCTVGALMRQGRAKADAMAERARAPRGHLGPVLYYRSSPRKRGPRRF